MDKFKIINQVMRDGHWYSIGMLTALVGFTVTKRTIWEMIGRGLIIEKEGSYKTTQAGLFTDTEKAKAIRSRDSRAIESRAAISCH